MLAGLWAAVDQGVSVGQAMQQARVWRNRQSVVGRALQSHNEHSIRRLVRLAALTDRIVKGAAPGKPWNALLELVLIQAAMIWLVRSLYFHGSLISAALDFGLVSAGLAAAAWAMINTGSLAAALWSFFLVQALFCWLPNLAQPSADAAQDRGQASSFQSAHRIAQDAVRKLSQP